MKKKSPCVRKIVAMNHPLLKRQQISPGGSTGSLLKSIFLQETQLLKDGTATQQLSRENHFISAHQMPPCIFRRFFGRENVPNSWFSLADVNHFLSCTRVTLPETNIFAPENGNFLLGPGLFSGAKWLLVSGRVYGHNPSYGKWLGGPICSWVFFTWTR